MTEVGSKDLIHHTLVGGQSIGEPKRHNQVFVMVVVCLKDYFVSVL